jgi:hypothetical protein
MSRSRYGNQGKRRITRYVADPPSTLGYLAFEEFESPRSNGQGGINSPKRNERHA